MLESDSEDEEEQGSGSGTRRSSGRDSGNASEDEQSSSRGPKTARRTKRSRSATPSEIDLNTAELLRSPLAKRKKLAAERSGLSRLKQGISAHDLHDDESDENARAGALNPSSSNQSSIAQGDEEESELDEEDGEEEDDFLAGALDEEWT